MVQLWIMIAGQGLSLNARFDPVFQQLAAITPPMQMDYQFTAYLRQAGLRQTELLYFCDSTFQEVQDEIILKSSSSKQEESPLNDLMTLNPK